MKLFLHLAAAAFSVVAAPRMASALPFDLCVDEQYDWRDGSWTSNGNSVYAEGDTVWVRLSPSDRMWRRPSLSVEMRCRRQARQTGAGDLGEWSCTEVGGPADAAGPLSAHIEWRQQQSPWVRYFYIGILQDTSSRDDDDPHHDRPRSGGMEWVGQLTCQP